MEVFDETKVNDTLDIVMIQSDGVLRIEGKLPNA